MGMKVTVPDIEWQTTGRNIRPPASKENSALMSFLRWEHLTATTRIQFVSPFFIKFANLAEVKKQ